MKNHFYKIWACLISVALCGCFGSSPPTSFYVLSPQSIPTADSNTAALRIAIGPITMAEYLSRSEILVRTSDHSLKVLDFEQWAEPLSHSIAQTISSKMETELAAQHALVFPYGISLRGNYEIPLQIERFDVLEGETAVIVAFWMIKKANGDEVLPWQRIVLSKPIEGDGTSAYVSTLSALTEKLATNMSALILPYISGKRATR